MPLIHTTQKNLSIISLTHHLMTTLFTNNITHKYMVYMSKFIINKLFEPHQQYPLVTTISCLLSSFLNTFIFFFNCYFLIYSCIIASFPLPYIRVVAWWFLFLIYFLEATLLVHAHNLWWESSTTLFIFISCYYFLL